MTQRVVVQLVGMFALVALGLWVAALVVTDFVVTDRWLPSLLVTSALLTVMVGLPAAALMRSAPRAAGQGRRGPRVAVFVLVVLLWLAAPLLLWWSVRISAAFGLPVSLTGFWPTVLTGAVTLVVPRVGAALVDAATRGRPGVLVVRVLPVVLCFAVLWLAEAGFDGVRLESGPAWQWWLTLVVLAAVMAAMASAVDLRGPGIVVVVVGVGIAWLLLWLLTSLSTLLDLTLSVSGFWAFAVTALALRAATWPGRLGHSPEPPDPFFDDPLPGDARS